MRRAGVGLVALIAVLVVLMLTVGKENDFGFACFVGFVAAALGLIGVGIAALVRRRQTS